jgi:hypothetical protein
MAFSGLPRRSADDIEPFFDRCHKVFDVGDEVVCEGDLALDD